MVRIALLSCCTLLMATLASSGATAGCCDLLKVDDGVAILTVRVCEPTSEGGCGALLFQGPIAIGESYPVCTAGETVVYEEWDELLAEFGPPVSAICMGSVGL